MGRVELQAVNPISIIECINFFALLGKKIFLVLLGKASDINRQFPDMPALRELAIALVKSGYVVLYRQALLMGWSK